MSVNFVSLNEVKKPEPQSKEKPKATKAAGKALRGYLKNRSNQEYLLIYCGSTLGEEL